MSSLLLIIALRCTCAKKLSYLGWNLLYLSKKRPKTNLTSLSIPKESTKQVFQYQISTLGERSERQLASKTNSNTFLQLSCSSLKVCESR